MTLSMTKASDLAVETYCTHTCTKYPNIKLNPSHCERRREKAGKTKSIFDGNPGSECLDCPGPIPRNQTQSQEELPRMELSSEENVFKPAKPFVPKCKCGDKEPKNYHPSNPYTCKACEKEYQRKRSHPGNIHLPPETLPSEHEIKRFEQAVAPAKFTCPIHGPHNGGKIGYKWNRHCPVCMQEKRIRGVQKAFKQAIVLRLEDFGWLRQWLADQAGCSNDDSSKIGEFAVRELAKAVPPEYIKDYLLREALDA